jgi:hypothetical protein
MLFQVLFRTKNKARAKFHFERARGKPVLGSTEKKVLIQSLASLFIMDAKIEKKSGHKKAPGTTPGLKPNPLEPTHPFPK